MYIFFFHLSKETLKGMHFQTKLLFLLETTHTYKGEGKMF